MCDRDQRLDPFVSFGATPITNPAEDTRIVQCRAECSGRFHTLCENLSLEILLRYTDTKCVTLICLSLHRPSHSYLHTHISFVAQTFTLIYLSLRRPSHSYISPCTDFHTHIFTLIYLSLHRPSHSYSFRCTDLHTHISFLAQTFTLI
jgi:hypothetical protein